MMVPINTSKEKMDLLSRTFGCQIGNLPFTYLGPPLGLTKPSVHDFLPMVQRIERRLVCCAQFLTQARKLEMVNSVLTSLPMYILSVVRMHVIVINQEDQYRKHLIWRGSDINNKKPPLAAWNGVSTKG